MARLILTLKLKCIEFSSSHDTDQIPYDGEPREEFVTIMVPVTTIFLILNIVGIVYAVICLMFNAIFHKKR